jgi:hypothetical protein
MKLGLLADIHEHVRELKLALTVFDRQGVDRIVCLGDVNEKGLSIHETVGLLAERNVPGVWGNHDFGLCSHPSALVVSSRVRYVGPVLDYLATYRPYLEIQDCHFSHVEPCRDANDVMELWSACELPDTPEHAAANFAARSQRVMFWGHHHCWLVSTKDGRTDWDGSAVTRLERPERYLVVVAPVCMGFCAIYDTSTAELVPITLQ